MRWLMAGVVLVCGLAVASLFVGVSNVSLAGILAGNDTDWLVLVESRVPRMLALLLAGLLLLFAEFLFANLVLKRIP